MKNLLQNPQGSESFLQEEALKHTKITNSLAKIFESWGYMPAKTPIFDYYDIYSEFTKNEDVYRLIDRKGELLLIRNDITLFLAKQLGVFLTKKDLPARVYYSDTILRYENSIDISKNEFFQTGAELLGVEKERGDLEILILLLEVFEKFKINKFLHIGSRKIFNLIFEKCAQISKDNLKKSILNRDKDFFISTATTQMIDKKKAEKFYELLTFMGTVDEFSNFFEQYTAGAVKEEAIYLINIVKKLESLNFSSEIRIDLSEIGTRDYYSGIFFKVYTENADSEVAVGGRYDGLLKKFGLETTSIGFSMMQRKIESLLNSSAVKREETTLSGDDTVELYKKAKELRKNGAVVKLC